MSALPLDTDIAAKRPEREQSAANASGDLSVLLPDIVWRVPGPSDLEIRKELAAAARDFCDRTNCWRKEVQFPGDFPHSPGRWPLAIPDGAIALRVRETVSWQSGRNAFRWRGLPGPRPLLDWHKWWATPPFLCGAAPLPVVSYAPAPDSETISNEVVQRWGYAFVAGAVARLLAMSDRPWFDKGRTAQQQAAADFNAAVVDARTESEEESQMGQPPGLGPLSTLPGTPFLI